ncbi:MAG: hypothetical protein LBP53_01715 [Candidatus Peribacteria bacterium]|nr:hypothetical protein [Candidatus Peribacteria bacterium]
MNAISTLIGRVGIPVSGFALEILLSVFGATTTFHISHWIGAFLLALTLNVVIEGLSLKRIFALPFKKNLWWLALANTISILICASLLIF